MKFAEILETSEGLKRKSLKVVHDEELLIFQAVAEPRNLVEILSKTCLYKIFETYLSYWGCLLAVNLHTYLQTSLLKCANNVPKLPGQIMLRKTGH